MKRRTLISLAVVVLAMVAVVPALAQDPEPAAAPTELQKSGVVSAFGETSVALDGAEGKELSVAPDLASVTIHGWTNLSRDRSAVRSEAWSVASKPIDYVRSDNYICRNSTCTTWYQHGAARARWVMVGWKWRDSGTANWYTRSQHYFRSGATTRTFYTSMRAFF